MKQPVFEGLATAIVTPFRNGTIDIPTFEKLLDAQLAANVDAIVVCGTTGESATLSSSEQLTLIAHAMQYTAGRCKIIAGTGSNDTAHAIDLSRAASSMGVSAVLIVTPYYNKCTQAGLIAHYEAIADAISCPVICYNVPSRTGLDLKLETCQALSKHPNIQGVKEAGGSPAKIAKIIETCGDSFFVPGPETTTRPSQRWRWARKGSSPFSPTCAPKRRSRCSARARKTISEPPAAYSGS